MYKIKHKGDNLTRFNFGVYEYENNYQKHSEGFDPTDELELITIGTAELNCFGYKNPLEVFTRWSLKFQRELGQKAGVPQIVRLLDDKTFKDEMINEIMTEEDC